MTAHPEQDFQRVVVQFLDLMLIDAWFTHFPAGGGGRVRGGVLKAMGLKAGVPDILIIRDGWIFWIELKSPLGRLSPVQRDTHKTLLLQGCGVAICRTLDEVRTALRTWEIPTREAA